MKPSGRIQLSRPDEVADHEPCMDTKGDFVAAYFMAVEKRFLRQERQAYTVSTRGSPSPQPRRKAWAVAGYKANDETHAAAAVGQMRSGGLHCSLLEAYLFSSLCNHPEDRLTKGQGSSTDSPHGWKGCHVWPEVPCSGWYCNRRQAVAVRVAVACLLGHAVIRRSGGKWTRVLSIGVKSVSGPAVERWCW